MFTKLFLIIFTAFYVMGCATSKTQDIEKKYNQLEVGMSPAQVKDHLGEPSLREAKDEVEIWYYSQGSGRDLQFKNKKLISFGVPKKEMAKPVDAPVLKDIGEKCSDDVVCLTQSCFLGRCVGPNNCWRKVKQTCTRETDCCYSKCDFGVCKAEK
ncbi:MAG: outer membrane protein assembly factor BamE [Oligoflexia bacterium]|nr:outer membrane protein assembly factor BamE [Oligoflexia bacterium]